MRISVLTPSVRPQGLSITQQSLAAQTFTDFEWLVEINQTGKHDLNAAYNRMLRRAQGVLVVSLQDFIKAPPDYLQKFWEYYIEHPCTFVTAPVGKVPNLDYQPPAKWDWRAYADAKPDYKCWEIDSGAAPLAALKEIGGFDEYLDQFWSFDNVSVGKRAHLAGYDFVNLFSNPAIAYDHDTFIPHPFRGNERPLRVEMRLKDYENGLRLSLY